MGQGEKIGITTTVPVEVVLAAGLTPVDLNNVFITSPERERLIGRAEARGFPGNLCAWIKGIYAAAHELGLRRAIGVVRGDCSSTEKLCEVWRHEGLEVVAFAYPFEPDPAQVAAALAALARALGAELEEAERWRARLRPLRQKLAELDDLTWQEGKVTGRENHLWLVSSSDFAGDPQCFEAELETFLAKARQRPARAPGPRIALAGVPPIVDDLHDQLEARGAAVVLNEVQRQFAMLADFPDLPRQYAAYTYPYGVFPRLDDLRRELARRRVHGLIHYAQTFCHRQVESILLADLLPVPVLTLEADRPGPLEARAKTRIEAFLEQLR